jgi:hypothetical protein
MSDAAESKPRPDPFWKRMPMVFVASVIVSAVLIALFLLVPIESRGKVIAPLSYISTAAILIGMSLYSWHQHRAALTGKRLGWLLNQGFTIEQLGAYSGLKGTCRGFFIRVYVDPTSHFVRRFGPDLCFLVYFQPMRTRDGKRDMRLLRRMENDLLNETNWIYAEQLSCHAIHMRSYTRLTIWVTQAKVKKRIEKVVDRVMQYGLKPWSEEEVEKWVRESPDLHGPDMETFRRFYASEE